MRYECEVCQKQYEVYATYYSHKKTHLEPTIACPTCGKLFRTNALLYRHAYVECRPKVAAVAPSVSRLTSSFAFDSNKW